MSLTIKYEDHIREELKDKGFALCYLKHSLEEAFDGTEESRSLFLLALRRVADVHGGIGNLSKKTQLGRESLYKTLSKKGNPRLSTLISIFVGLNLDLSKK